MKFQMKGLDAYIRSLEAIANPYAAEAYIKRAIRDGTDIVADATRRELQGIRTDPRPFVPAAEGKRKGLLPVQKAALLSSFGVTQIQEKNDFINDKTGVQRGTNKLGQPNVKVARMLESGTSYLPKDRVFTRASRNSRNECLEEMQKSLSRAYTELMK